MIWYQLSFLPPQYLVALNFFYNVSKSIESVCTVHIEFFVVKNHKVAINASRLFLPCSVEFQLRVAVISIKIISFAFNPNKFPGLHHYHKISVRMAIPAYVPALSFNNSVPPADVICANNDINYFSFEVIHVIFFSFIERIRD